ncbi:MAG: HAMP domain-containing histidine kinase [Lachnospiraceae bacterium]|nr:HAMP domain-containing histidine kinase [Lachnospiraceae bacterium]
MKELGKCRNGRNGIRSWWKNYQTAVWIEVVFLGIICICSVYLFSMEKQNQEAEAEAVMTEIQKAVEAAADSGDAEEILYTALDALPRTGDELADNCYEVAAGVYSSTGFSQGTTNDNIICRWQSYEDGEIRTEYISLEKYFEDEITDFFDVYRQNQQRSHRLYISEMDGYYHGEDDFCPMRVVLCDSYTGEIVYELTNSWYENENYTSVMVRRLTELQEAETGSGDSEQMQSGYFSVYICDSELLSVPEKYDMSMAEDDIREIYSGGSRYFIHLTNVNRFGAYECCISVNIRKLTLHSGIIRQYILPILALGEALAVFLICVYVYIKKKQENIRRLRETFLNAIAHEMKTPTAVIKNSAECLEAGLQQEKQTHYINMIGSEADHMNDLLNSMLVYTRVTDAECEMKKEPYLLKETAERICGRYEDLMQKKELSLTWDIQGSGQVTSDPVLMEMVMDNYISNAVKFCSTKGGIRITVYEHGVSVYNDGPELSAEELSCIWEPLYQGDASRTARDGSSGMGLAISEAILKMYRADYGARNKAGGPEFYFHIR